MTRKKRINLFRSLEPGAPPVLAKWDALRAALLDVAQRQQRQRGGRTPTRNRDLQALVDRLAAENPEATARELWELIPNEGDHDEDADLRIYRTGGKVVVVREDRKGRVETARAYVSFRRYVTHARKR